MTGDNPLGIFFLENDDENYIKNLDLSNLLELKIQTISVAFKIFLLLFSISIIIT